MKQVIKSTRLLEKMSILALETITMLAWLILFWPKEQPPYYNDLLFDNINGEDNEAKSINIFKISLPNTAELSAVNGFNENINQASKYFRNFEYDGEGIPIIIINPVILEMNNQHNNILNTLEKVSITILKD